MKKDLLLGILSAAALLMPSDTFGQQTSTDVTYYWPKERVETLASGQKYFMFNAAYDNSASPNDRGNFLFANGGSNFGTLNPKQTASSFVTQENKFLFTITAENNAANTYKIQNSNNEYINFTGAASNNNPGVFLIQNWASSNANKNANCGAKDDNGAYVAPNQLGTQKVWTVTNNAQTNNHWNGNGNFVTWSEAHPYAFFTVGQVTLDQATKTILDGRWNNGETGTAKEMAWNLQKAYGMVTDASKIVSNKPETTPSENSSYAHLIDGNDNTYFHSSWTNKGTDKHYLQFEIANPETSFHFITKRRHNNTVLRPTEIKIEGSNTADGAFTLIETISTGLPTTADEWYYFSNKITATQAYKYLRFTVMNTTNREIFFHFSEFYLISGTNTAAVDAMTAVRNYYNLNFKDANFTSETASTAKSTFETQLTAVKNAANNSTYTIKYVDAQNKEFGSSTMTIQANHATALPVLVFREATKVSAGTFDNTNKTITLTGTESIANKTITVTYADKLPFTASESNLANAKWYQFSVHTDGSKRYVKYNSANKNEVTLVPTDQAQLTDDFLWCFVGNMTDGFKIYNKAGGSAEAITYSTTGKAIMANPATDADASTWILGEVRDDNAKRQGAFSWKTKKTTGLDGNNTYLNHRGTYLAFWSDNDAGSSFFTHDIDAECNKKLTDALTRAAEYQNMFGNGLNQFPTSQKTNFDQKVTEANNSKNGTNQQKVDAANALITACEALTLNEPATGKFYRFKSVTYNNYVDASAKTGRPTMVATATDANTVFFYTADKKLVTCNLLCMTNYDITSTLGGNTTIQTSKAKPGYVIRNGANVVSSYCAKPTGQLMDREGDENAGKTNPNCAWILEEVTEPTHQPKLTKAIGDANYATISAPVALTIPAGVNAYTASVNTGNQQATLHQLTGVIPAGVGVVLKKTSADTNFDFTLSAELGDATTANQNNNLKPLYADTSIPTATTAYVLAKLTNGEIGFYLLKTNGTTEERTVGANKAYLVLPNVAPANALLSIVIGGSTTGIENMNQNAGEKEIYFDLQGRRVENPSKGIYVTRSGKKVVFN